MKTTTTTKTLEETKLEISNDELEEIILKGVGIKKMKGLGISLDYDISSEGYLRGVIVRTRFETESFK